MCVMHSAKKDDNPPVTIGLCPGLLDGDPPQLQMQLPDGSVRAYPQTDAGRALFWRDVKAMGVSIKSDDPDAQRALLQQMVMMEAAENKTAPGDISKKLKELNDEVKKLELSDADLAATLPQPKSLQPPLHAPSREDALANIDLFNALDDSDDEKEGGVNAQVYKALLEFKYPGGGIRFIEAGMYRPSDHASKVEREKRLLEKAVEDGKTEEETTAQADACRRDNPEACLNCGA